MSLPTKDLKPTRFNGLDAGAQNIDQVGLHFSNTTAIFKCHNSETHREMITFRPFPARLKLRYLI